MSGGWRRLPAFLPNISLKLLPLSEAEQAAYQQTGRVRELVFKTAPSVSKLEIKAFLEGVYGLSVAKVNTLNVEGKKKRGKFGFFRRPDYKKAFTAAALQAAQAAGAGHGGFVPDPVGDQDRNVYVSFEEKREPSDRKPPRKSSGHTYTVKFFLVDQNGVEYLAAVGEDQGDAHYLYENTGIFPFLRANNKADVRSWLEGIIERSKDRAGVHGHLVQDSVPQDPNLVRLPKFVAHKQSKHELPDGRHRIEWFLIDEADDAHLAIVGEEKETRDGHYLYRTQGVFDTALPLQVGNQREVERWLDVMVFHGGVAPRPASGKAMAGDSLGGAPAPSGGRAHSGLVSDGSGHRLSRGGGAAAAAAGGSASRPSGQKAGQKHDLLKQATSNQAKKAKTQAPRAAADPDQDARDAVATELTKWAGEEAQRRETVKKQAMHYATDPLAGKEAAAARRCLTVLKQAVDKASFLLGGAASATRGSSGGSHQQQVNLVDTLAALRELGHMYAPLSLVAMPELKECLGRLKSHPHPEVAGLARQVLEQWLKVAVAQAQVLTDPRYVQDPRSVLDAQLTNRQVMDPVVSAATRRKLHPPPAAAAQPPRPAAAPAGAAGQRPASRLGGAAPAALPLLPGAAETPAAGLVARPSEQSLGGLLGLGSGGCEAHTAMDLDLGLPAAGGSDAAALAQQTAERRRLNLEALDSPAEVLTAKGRRRNEQQEADSSTDEEAEEEGEGGAAAAGAKHGGLADDLEPSIAPPSSMLLEGDSDALGGGGRGGRLSTGATGGRRGEGLEGGGLTYAASVDLIDAPISEMESEQAELLPG
ncbi:50S ribosomal L23 isoform B [Chlorella sorokiniana]|uniref:Large ribosomal subunit protein uL23c n=1 Tax=Chlorella sorokiniana TaxID=3076 RepID=A0A2P6TLS0_CHLSO|nr:50S ribosomal L23 isoform B [Chlorella sorokiniana]|eukprot:PRW45230.1 50S ribosomal L23 isoform B [Chlorella sorokiniana]